MATIIMIVGGGFGTCVEQNNMNCYHCLHYNCSARPLCMSQWWNHYILHST